MDEATIKKFNIYCDETRVENLDSQFMVIGALLVPRAQVDAVKEELKNLCKQYEFSQEIKWNKVGNKYATYYQNIVDYFFQNESLQFRCIIVDKSKVKYDIYHENDKELAFFKFYYLLLRDILDDNSQYFIFLDKKPTRDKNRARALNAFLDSHLLIHREQSQIKHFQAYNSSENVLIQLSDLLTGLFGYSNNTRVVGQKGEITSYFQSKAGIDLNKTTRKSATKINILKWIPNI